MVLTLVNPFIQEITKKVIDANDSLWDDVPNTTILLPTLNEEWHVEQTIDSIQSQNIYQAYPDKFELILIDSYSDDNTVKIAEKKFRPNIDKIYFTEKSLITARTVGVERARRSSEIIVFTDGDAIYPVNWLNLMLKHYQNPDTVGVFGANVHFNYHLKMFENMIKTFDFLLGRVQFGTGRMIGQNSSVLRLAFEMVDGFSVPYDYDPHSSGDTAKVLEGDFAKKLDEIGNVVYDPYLIVYDDGARRRFDYTFRQMTCNTDISQLKSDFDYYTCKYWNEREQKERF